MLFTEAIKKYESWKTYSVKHFTLRGDSYDLRHFCLFLRNPELENVGLDDVLDFLKYSKEIGWSNNSLAKKAKVIEKFFVFCVDMGWKVPSPKLIPRMSYEHQIAKVIDDENYNILIKSIKTNYTDDLRNRLLLMMLWDTGARNGEVLSLNIEDLDMEKQKAIIRTEKAKFHRPFREVMWTEKTNEVLKRWLERRGVKTGALFIQLSNNPHSGKTRLTPNGLSGLLRKLCDDAKIERFNPHSFRHHMAHDILNKGGSIMGVAKILGHSSPKSSFNYIQMNDKELEETYRKIKGK